MSGKRAAFTIEADLRDATGRSAARRLRRAGKVPAVVYGGGGPELPIALDDVAMRKPLADESFYTSLIELRIRGRKRSETVLLKDAQWHPVREHVMHLDFQRVHGSDRVHVEVPVHPRNAEKSPGVVKGGRVDLVRHVLEVVCRADAIPDAIEVDCAALDWGDTVHVDDLVLPAGVEVPHEVNFTVLNMAAPKGAVAEEEPETDAGS
ncbi:MAG: 50S ribosomal protein L25/general stress protein Ctc [Zetaproteobacteria bacterium]|nr:MAG: 50S ribosomal protein L25/general stress protein Ctc [Zetaproteobacteria bacterium]